MLRTRGIASGTGAGHGDNAQATDHYRGGHSDQNSEGSHAHGNAPLGRYRSLVPSERAIVAAHSRSRPLPSSAFHRAQVLLAGPPVKEAVVTGHDERVEALSPDRARAYESLVRMHGDAVLRFLRRRTDPQTAEDVFSETMLVLWRRFDDVPEEPLPWLYVTARNCLRSTQRSTRRQWRVVEKITTIDPPTDTVDAGPEEDPRTDCLRNALARLSPTDAEVLRLWAWEELAAREIATVLNTSVNAATIRLHRAKKKLRQEMDKIHQSTTTKGGSR